jgi:hypothetical protein
MSGSGSPERRRLPKNAVVAAVACGLLAVSQSTNVYSFMQGTPDHFRISLAYLFYQDVLAST